jgi:electron transfer flavoprotein beta subunit
MKILALVKQVPGTSEVFIDPERGTLVREGVPAKTNPYDLHALEAALQTRDTLRAAGYPSAVTVVSMGPLQAEAVIRESYWMGADDGILLTDRAFAGADTLATAFALSQAARKSGFDLIIAGMQSTDGDTAQVGPGVAEFLGIPHVSYVRSVNRVGPGSIEVTADLGDRYLTQEISFPCLITVTPELNQPRLPSLRTRKETMARTVAVVRPGDLPPAGEKHYGLSGSPTRVERVFPPKIERVQEMWEGPAAELANRLAALLNEVLSP